MTNRELIKKLIDLPLDMEVRINIPDEPLTSLCIETVGIDYSNITAHIILSETLFEEEENTQH